MAYFLARSSSIATAGRTLPSTNSRMRRHQWRCRRFCQRYRTGRLLPVSPPPAIENASLSAIALATFSVPLRKFGNSNTPTGPFHRIVLRFSGFQPVSVQKRRPVRICSSSLMSFTDFRGSSRRFGELSGNANIGWNRDITGTQQAFGFVNRSASYRDLPTLWP